MATKKKSGESSARMARRIVMRPLSAVTPSARNPRRHSDEQVAQIAASIERFGFNNPILVARGVVVAGHGRRQAAELLGLEKVPVVELDHLTERERRAYLVADNRLAELADWDEELLASELGALEQLEAGLAETAGFSEDELARLAELVAEDVDGDEGTAFSRSDADQVPAVEDAVVSRSGDVWVLGEHRLLCGDSTRLEEVRRVVGHGQARLVATDPPYLVDYTGERPNDSGKDWSGLFVDEVGDADAFFRSVFSNVLDVLAPRAAVYCWHAHRRASLLAQIWENLGLVAHQVIIWVKPTPTFGRVYWHFRHEPCLMGWRQGSKPPHDGKHEHNSVWEVDWEGNARSDGEHPTSKPVELFARPMRKHTRRGDIVFEPFCGSGSQLVAAELLGRRCRAIELVPAFVDVAVRRWQSLTRRAARLEARGKKTRKTFNQVQKQRART